MAIARRDLLGFGAALALSALTSSCSDAGGSGTPLATRPVPPSETPSATPRPTFPGQPPPGSLYFGASVPHGRSLPEWEDRLGRTLALHRSYFTEDHNETAQLVRRCRDDLARGRMPHVSIKPLSTWQDVASGRRDSWLEGLLRPLGELSAPLFLTLHHEPENDAGDWGMRPSDFVAMQRHVIKVAAELAPEVTIVPVLQYWTFDALRDDFDPPVWIVEEARVMGLDIYNPWSPTNGRQWRSFGSKVDEALAWLGDTPLAIGEYGCRDDPSNPGLSAQWLRDAAEYALTHNVVSMSYFNSGQNSPHGEWVLRGDTERAFADLLASEWVVRPG